MQWYEISHKVKDCFSIQRGEAKLNNVDLSPNAKSCTIAQINAISHLCCTTRRMLTKLNTIDKNLVPWISRVSSLFFLLAKYMYSQRTTNV